VGESAENLALMRRIDEQYLATPFYGSRRMAVVLGAGRKRMQRLMRLMGIEAIYPKRRTTWPSAGHKIYPYLLRNVEVLRPDHVWSTDITYVPLRHGFLYLVAVLDWFSRHVLSWRLSNTLSESFCLEALEAALQLATPEIFNSEWRRRQYGWSRARSGQRVHRALVAKREVRGGLPAGLRRRLGGGRTISGVLPLLFARTASPIAGLPHPGGRLSPAKLKAAASTRRRTSKSFRAQETENPTVLNE
jgi:putative transposase